MRGSLALAFLVSTSLWVAAASSAAPSKQDLAAAKAKLGALQDHLSLVDEQYNQARIQLQSAEDKLAATRQAAQRASETAERAIADLNARAAAAYQGVGSEISLILGADSFSDFTDRIEFVGSIAQADADLATRAETAKQQARWTADQLSKAVADRARLVRMLAQQQGELKRGVAEAQALITEIDHAIKAAAAARQAARTPSLITGTGGTGGTGGANPPPAPNPNAQAAIDAAYSVLGVPYQYAGASPQTGFDCSGLTMWAWAHAGVSLPHSSAMQYAVLPHVDQTQLQPGDLLFFYSPIHHVGMYVGGGRMIHSPHTGGVVEVIPVYWQYFVGAARPD